MAAMSTTQVASRMALAQPARSLRSSVSSSRVFGVAPLAPRCLPSFRCVAQTQQTSSSAPDLQVGLRSGAPSWALPYPRQPLDRSLADQYHVL